MQKTLLAVLLVASATTVVAQRDAWPTHGSHSYVGQITSKAGPLGIQMTLTLPQVNGELGADQQAIIGEYRYERRGRPLRLVGDGISKDGKLVLREYVMGKAGTGDTCTGRFEGRIDGGARRFHGMWIRADNKARLPFELKLAAVTQEVTMRTPLGEKWEQSSLVFLGRSEMAKAATRALRDVVHAQLDRRSEIEKQPSWVEERAVEDTEMAAPAGLTTITGAQTFAAFHVGDKLVSVGSLVWMYGGGAHPNSGYTSLNLIERAGKVEPLKLRDLALSPSAGPELYKMVWGDLQRQGASDAKKVPAGPLDEKTLDTFVLSPAGIVFAFAPYEVGCYAEGPYFVRLSWAQLNGVLAPPKELYR